MLVSVDTRKTLDSVATQFHRIAMALQARELLGRGVANEVLRAEIEKQQLTDNEIASLCADGFEACVRALASLGADDVSIHECNPTEALP